jgi:cation transport regulator
MHHWTGRAATCGAVYHGSVPYARNDDLPKSVREHLPQAARTIYRKAYNSAWKLYASAAKRRGYASREETSHRVAWAAVKASYRKAGDIWVRKSGPSTLDAD